MHFCTRPIAALFARPRAACLALSCWLVTLSCASAAATGSPSAAPGSPAAAVTTSAATASKSGLLVLSRDQQVALAIRTAAIGPAETPALSLPGSVVVPPERQAIVASAAPGLLTEVRVAVGDRVRAGQVLARISSPQLVEMQRQLLSASAQRDLARDTLDRDESLLAEGLIAQTRVRAARTRMVEADALVAERSLQLRLAGMPDTGVAQTPLQAQAVIASPVDGIVIEATALRGQRVEAATSLFRIAQGSELWLELQAPPERVAAIALGDRVDWPQRGVTARVTAIGAAVTSGQSVTVRARIESSTDQIRPGETLQARVRVGIPARAQWRVPATAIAQLPGRTVLFVSSAEGVRVVAVTVHGRDEDNAMIEAALQPADRVVVSGVSALKAMISEAR